LCPLYFVFKFQPVPAIFCSSKMEIHPDCYH
jgi:hypothetical protein